MGLSASGTGHNVSAFMHGLKGQFPKPQVQWLPVTPLLPGKLKTSTHPWVCQTYLPWQHLALRTCSTIHLRAGTSHKHLEASHSWGWKAADKAPCLTGQHEQRKFCQEAEVSGASLLRSLQALGKISKMVQTVVKTAISFSADFCFITLPSMVGDVGWVWVFWRSA